MILLAPAARDTADAVWLPNSCGVQEQGRLQAPQEDQVRRLGCQTTLAASSDAGWSSASSRPWLPSFRVAWRVLKTASEA